MFKSKVAKQGWFIDVLKAVENDKMAGYKGDYWIPHKSSEGGSKTIGYGHKIQGNGVVTVNGKEYNLKYDHIPNRVIEQLFLQDIALAEKKASEQFTEFMPMGKDYRWNDLPLSYKSIYTELVFNIGTLKDKKGKWEWKKLAKGMKDNNHPTIMKEIGRTYWSEDKQEDVPLVKRVKDLNKAYKKVLGVSESPSGRQIGRLQRIKDILPFFDKLSRAAQAKLMVKVMKQEEQQRVEDDLNKSIYNTLMEEANARDIQVHEEREEARRVEAEVTLQQEVTEATKVVPVEEKVIDEPLADVQYFQKPDGSVIKVDSTGAILSD